MHGRARCSGRAVVYRFARPTTQPRRRSKSVGIIGLLVVLILIVLLLRLL
jgi:hypothetical protein